MGILILIFCLLQVYNLRGLIPRGLTISLRNVLGTLIVVRELMYCCGFDSPQNFDITYIWSIWAEGEFFHIRIAHTCIFIFMTIGLVF